jgi:hypothetical protein
VLGKQVKFQDGERSYRGRVGGRGHGPLPLARPSILGTSTKGSVGRDKAGWRAPPDRRHFVIMGKLGLAMFRESFCAFCRRFWVQKCGKLCEAQILSASTVVGM